jgi:hypothetical protein
MPEYVVTSPEGKKFKITAPEGATRDQVLSYAKKQFASGDAKQPEKPAEGGMWNSAADFFRGIAKGALSQATAEGQAEESLQTGGGQRTVPSAQEASKLVGLKETPKGGSFTEAAGQGLGTPSNWMMPGGIIAKTLSILGASLGGEAGARLTPGSAVGPVIGGMAGGMVGAVPGAARVGAELTARANPLGRDPVRQGMVRTLEQEGVTPTAGETLDSKGIREGERFGSLPGGGKSYQDMKARVGDQLTQAVARKMGEMPGPGAGMTPTEFTPEIWERSSKRIGKMYEDSIDRIGITFNDNFRDAVNDLRLKAIMDADSPETTSAVHRVLDRLLPTKAPGDLWYVDKRTGLEKMRGSAYQEVTSSKSALQALIDSGLGNRKSFGLDIDKLLKNEVRRSARGPLQKQALAQFEEANRQYWVRKVALNSITDEGAKQGHIDPQKLARALKGEEGLQEGSTDLHRLANAARAVLEPYSPLGFGGAHESGGRGMMASAGRMGAGAVAGGGLGLAAGGVPGAAIGSAAGAISPGLVARKINSPGVQAYLKGRPDFRDYLQRRGLLTTPAQRVDTAARSSLIGGAIGERREKEKPKPRIYEGQ